MARKKINDVLYRGSIGIPFCSSKTIHKIDDILQLVNLCLHKSSCI